MLAAQRRSLILEKAYREKRVIVGELSKEFGVSEETIRRDLERLEEEGHVTKEYGGAVVSAKSGIDLPFNIRRQSNPLGKQKIAELICSQLNKGEHIFLDASTTAVFIAKNIKPLEGLTVITNSIENIVELADAPSIEIISTGGKLNIGSMSLLGRKAADSISEYNVDKVIMSCKGFDTVKGISDGNDETSSIKRNMIEAAEKVYLAVDSTNFGKTAFSKICDISEIDIVVTDKKPNDMWIEYLKANNVECIYPE